LDLQGGIEEPVESSSEEEPMKIQVDLAKVMRKKLEAALRQQVFDVIT
jgi:hypothetical protein